MSFAVAGVAYANPSYFAAGIEDIISARDGLRDPVDVEDNELDAVRRILVESATEFATLIQEWRFYILSIGRDQYINKT